MDERAARAIRPDVVGVGLLLLAAAAWIAVNGGRADLMDVGAGSFVAAWTVMMAAMMLPSMVPAARALRQFSADRPAVLPFTAGYLSVWAAVGLVTAGVLAAVGARDLMLGGYGVTAAILVAAAVYEGTPAKHACLRRCRNPIGLIVRHWRPGPSGAARLGLVNGAWCTGCCWALMAVLFALGAMSIGWMLVVAGMVAVEKLLPWRRLATVAVTVSLLALAVMELAR